MFSVFKKEIRENLSLSIPLVASQLVYALSNFISIAFIAKLGEETLAASILVSTLWLTLFVFFFGILNSVSILVSHQYGAKNQQGISEIMGQSYILGTLIILALILLLIVMSWFLRFSEQTPQVLNLAKQYIFSLAWTVPGLVMLVISEQFLAGIHKPKLVLQISLIIVPFEITLLYLLIFGRFGLPAYGIAGIGYAFAITYTFTAITLIIYLLKSKHYQHYKILKGINKLNISHLKELIGIGLPMGFMYLIEVSALAFTTLWMARFGTTMLAANQIVSQYLGLVITLISAMSQTVTVRVGYAIGKQDLSGIGDAIIVGILLTSFCMLITAILFNFFPQLFLLVDINIKDPANVPLIRDASALLAVCGILLIFDNIRIIGFGALRGFKDTRFPMYAVFIELWIVGLSSAYIFSFVLNFNGVGIWWGLTLGIAFGALLNLLRVKYMLKKIQMAPIA